MSTSKKYTAFILAIFTITTTAIIAFTFYEVIRFSHNFGLGRDEATYIIQSTIDFVTAQTWSERLFSMLPAHGQHVLLGMTSTNLLSYWLLGTLSFKFINAFNLFLLFLAGCMLLHSYAASVKYKILLASIIFPLLLSPVHNQCMLMASCTSNHYFGLAFSVAALYFFSRITNNRGQFIAAEVCCVWATLSFATGILVPVAGLYLLYRSTQLLRWKLVAIHLMISSLTLLIYYYRTQPITLATPDLSELQDILAFGLWLTGYTMGLIGTVVMWLYSAYPLVLFALGISILLLLVWFAIRYRHEINRHPFLLCGALLFFAMLMMIAFGRYFSQIAPRYAAYNILFLLFSILLIFRIHDDRCDQHQQPEKKLAKYYVLAGVVLLQFTAALYFHLPYAYSQDNANQVCLSRWKQNQQLNSAGVWCHFNISEGEMRALTAKAEMLGIYHVDD